MSATSLETALYAVASTREGRKHFLADRSAFLEGFVLDEEERRAMLDFDVARLCGLGVSPLLVLGYWLEAEGSKSVATYMTRVRGRRSE